MSDVDNEVSSNAKGDFVGKGFHWWDVMLGQSKKGKGISLLL